MYNIKRLNKIKTTSLSFCLRETPFGPVAIVWSLFHGRPMIQRVILSKPGSSAGLLMATRHPDCSSSSCPEIDTVADRVGMIKNLSPADKRSYNAGLLEADEAGLYQPSRKSQSH